MCCIFTTEIIQKESMLASIFGTVVNFSWLMSSARGVFWQISPKRCNGEQRKERYDWKLVNKKQRAKFSVHPCVQLMQRMLLSIESVNLGLCHVCFVRNPQINRTSGCVTPDLGDSLWQENNKPQFLKIDKLVYSHAVNCLISKLTNHELKVTGFPKTSLCSST